MKETLLNELLKENDISVLFHESEKIVLKINLTEVKQLTKFNSKDM